MGEEQACARKEKITDGLGLSQWLVKAMQSHRCPENPLSVKEKVGMRGSNRVNHLL